MTIKEIKFLDAYLIGICLEDGRYVEYDFQNKIKTARFADLADIDLFKKGKISDGKNITWNEMTEISLSEILKG